MGKYKSLDFGKKREIIDAVESGEKKSDVAKRFDIPPSTLSTILKNKDKVPIGNGRVNKKKRNRPGEFPRLEECLLSWLEQCLGQNIPIDGPLFKGKALKFASELGLTDFRASEGWLEKFKNRHDVVFKKICGESATVGNDICTEWKKELQVLIAGYEPQNIFNADELGLFFKCLPDKTLTFKNDKCSGGKRSKERVTLLLAANADGSEKLKPYMIGKYAKPRCFIGIRSFPITYRANSKAWMTSQLFQEWLSDLDKEMQSQKRKILLLVDNCSAHQLAPEPLKNVRVEFLPPNTTSKLQPLDAGIIKCFKGLYRKDIVARLIDAIDSGKEDNIDILTAMKIAHKAWTNISPQTIRNCFRACGFDNVESEDLTGTEIDDTAFHKGWHFLLSHQGISIEFEEFLHIDDDVAVYGTLSDAEIIENVLEPCNESADEEDPATEQPVVKISSKQARDALDSVRSYLEQLDLDDKVFDALVTLENNVDRARWSNLSQSKITDYFQK